MSTPRAVILDRDGTLIKHVPYLCSAAQVELLPGVRDGILALKAAGVTVCLHSNQSGVGRGHFSRQDVVDCNQRLIELLDVGPDPFDLTCIAFEAPYQPSRYRKPSPAFAHEVMRGLGIPPESVWYVGDRDTDLQTAIAAGTQAVAVNTGFGGFGILAHEFSVFDRFDKAIQHILSYEPKGSLRKLQGIDAIVSWRDTARQSGKRVVLTNGCFDILHAGHVAYLEEAAESKDELLVVAVNSDVSVQELKGPGRPVNTAVDRARVLAGLQAVERLFIFNGTRLTDSILALKPDAYVKAGDYTLETLDKGELEALRQVKAEIRFAKFIPGHSTTRALSSSHGFAASAAELGSVLQSMMALETVVARAGGIIVSSLGAGGKVLTCGNGGSAADALHLAEEFVGRYRAKRPALPAVCLAADPTALTCIANDFGFDQVFARQIEAIGKPGDVLVAFTTSGESPNIIEALRAAHAAGIATVVLTGGTGGRAVQLANVSIVVPSNNAARVQELHTLVLHALLETVETPYA